VLILSLDTSSAAGSAAVTRDGVVLVERRGDGARTHGERLPRELMTVLEEAGVALRAIDRFAIATGPGSFTGLRVGIATMQGLALAQQKLVSPVSTFEALAFLSSDLHVPPLTATAIWIDAHRGEVFAALYAPDGRTILAAPSSLSPEATLDAWASATDGDVTVRFAGDGAIKYADAIRLRLGSRAILPDDVPALAGGIARIAARDPERAVQPHAVVPLYVRRSAVELARDRQQAGE
jgi:tRNA threonylcarbamoyladenosine biosynthesis protein TsaB